MHRAALVFGVREHLAHGLQHPHALVADDELHAIQAASAEPLVAGETLLPHSASVMSSTRLRFLELIL